MVPTASTENGLGEELGEEGEEGGLNVTGEMEPATVLAEGLLREV